MTDDDQCKPVWPSWLWGIYSALMRMIRVYIWATVTYATHLPHNITYVKTYVVDVNTSRTPVEGIHSPSWPNRRIITILYPTARLLTLYVVCISWVQVSALPCTDPKKKNRALHRRKGVAELVTEASQQICTSCVVYSMLGAGFVLGVLG
jgi:hypothetical protein